MTCNENIVEKDVMREATTRPAIEAVPGLRLPTKSNLDQLREKFLSVYDAASILESKTLPWYCIHRDFNQIGPARAPTGPIPGNDYHSIDPRITSDPSAWAAKLHFNPIHRSALAGTQILDPLTVPFKHVVDCLDLDDGGDKLEETAALIRYLWPREDIQKPTRRFVGDLLTDTASPEYYIFHWLASKQPLSAGVWVRILTRVSEGYFVPAQRRPAIIQRVLRHGDVCNEASALPDSAADIRLQGKPFSSAQYWSFFELANSPMSFETIATILSLLTSPSKFNGPMECVDPFADRDISWALDSLHGFCRQKSPHQAESERSLSFTLGTSSDFWMYFHFVSHSYVLYDDNLPAHSDASGMEIRRSQFTVPIELGGFQNNLKFIEHRTWIGMRVATNYNGRVPNASPSAVAVSVSDLGHSEINMSPCVWEQRGIRSPDHAAGVALFQMAIWSHLDHWEKDWNRTLNYVDDAFRVKPSSQADIDRLNEIITNFHQSAASCSRLIMLLMGFNNHIDMVVDSVKKMHDEWARTYFGRGAERLERFDVETQEVLLENWKGVLSHLGDVNARLNTRIQRSISDLRIIREGLSIS